MRGVKKVKKQSILLTFSLLVILFSISAVNAADTYVNGSVAASGDGSSWEQAYKTIKEGYNGVTDSNTVNIAAGTYTGDDNKGIMVDKDITIQGAGQDQTIIDCEDLGYVFDVQADKTVNIKDLTITNGNCAGGAIPNSGTLTVERCEFTSNSATWGGAINNDGTLTVTNCKFNDNYATMTGGAIYNIGFLTVTGSNFWDNTADSNAGAIYGHCGYALVSWIKVTYSRFVGNIASNTPNDIYIMCDPEYGPYGLNVRYNWWGSNSEPTEKITGYYDPTVPSMWTPWLVMNINADPSTIYTGQTSTLTADVYTDSAGTDHSADAAQFFSGPQVTFTTDLGNVGSKSTTVNWILGMAIATLRGDEAAGMATVTAADGQVVSTTVNILQSPTVNAATSTNGTTNTDGTIGMHETGTPIVGLLLAFLMLVGGLVVSKR
ncbi:MAG: hypothetical protein A4E25_01352 [Methanobacterium sp. PtaB.Bin024]|nr:MAG: hypothetical protein A4E25_01352 [Methanobacterium sp. PtaB.Bin024]